MSNNKFALGDYVKIKPTHNNDPLFNPPRALEGIVVSITFYINGLIVYQVDDGKKCKSYYTECQLEGGEE